MKNDARLLLNKKKWKKGINNKKPEIWKSRGHVDARKILNIKRSQKMKPPVLGSYMRTKSATALIAEQIKREISAPPKVPNKQVHLSRDGNIIVTSKSRNTSQGIGRSEAAPKFSFSMHSRNRPVEDAMQYQPSTSNMDDLEYTAIEDLLDLESLPPAYIAPKPLQRSNLSSNSVLNQVLDKRYTMVADQLPQYSNSINSKVYVSNLHPTVSRQDVMELFGDIGAIKSIDMVLPGAAVIEFFDEHDAVKACEIYHNRLLDGLPMKCYLQNGSTPQKFAISQRLGNRNEPNISSPNAVLSPTLFNPRSRYNPHNVQFTVKLP